MWLQPTQPSHGVQVAAYSSSRQPAEHQLIRPLSHAALTQLPSANGATVQHMSAVQAYTNHTTTDHLMAKACQHALAPTEQQQPPLCAPCPLLQLHIMNTTPLHVFTITGACQQLLPMRVTCVLFQPEDISPSIHLDVPSAAPELGLSIDMGWPPKPCPWATSVWPVKVPVRQGGCPPHMGTGRHVTRAPAVT